MAIDPKKIIHELAKRFKYQVLTQLLDKEIIIQGPDTISDNVLNAIALYSDDTAKLLSRRENMLGALSKYGILDLNFEIPEDVLLDIKKPGIPGLRELGFLSREDIDITEACREEACEILECMLQDAKHDNAFLLIFMSTSEPFPMPEKRSIAEILEGPPPDFWPRSFCIIDACITNSSYAWFMKHFYW